MAADRAPFFAAARKSLFGGRLSQDAVDDLTAILDAWPTYGDGDDRKLAYILGTAFHESDRFKTMEEYASGAAYEGRKSLGNTQPGDGERFKGRGFVQITGRRNYADWAKRTARPLVSQPALVSERALAARILVQGMMLGTFTGKKLATYIAGSKADYTNARRTVNGTDKAALIAGHAAKFAAALGVTSVIVARKPVATKASPPVPLPAQPPAPGVPPALIVATKERLRAKGYFTVGMPEPDVGPVSIGAISRVQATLGIPVTGQLDDATMKAIWSDDFPDAPVAPERANVKPEDLKARGNKITAAADKAKAAAATGKAIVGGGFGLGTLTVIGSAIADFFGDAWEKLAPVREAFSDVPGWAWGGGAMLLCFVLYRQHEEAKKAAEEAEEAELDAIRSGRQM